MFFAYPFYSAVYLFCLDRLNAFFALQVFEVILILRPIPVGMIAQSAQSVFNMSPWNIDVLGTIGRKKSILFEAIASAK
jgi:hypothetical protein